MTYALTLLRHGESEGNRDGILQGQSDMALTQLGLEQANLLAARWQATGRSFDLIISSPLRRALQTAGCIGAALGIPIEIDPLWKERGFGQIEGKTLAEIEMIQPPVNFYQVYTPVGGDGESQMDVYLRACQGLQNVLRRPDGHYLIVSHGAILNMALYAILGLSPQTNYNSPRFRFQNTSFAEFEYAPVTRQWHVLGFNEQAASLPGEDDSPSDSLP